MDYRLIAVDMDGTLLDQHGNIPNRFAEIYQKLRRADSVFAPASGRQLATLQDMFGELGPEMSYIAENGAVVVHRGRVTSTTPMDPELVLTVIRAVTDYNAAKAEPGQQMRLIVCEPEVGYVCSAADAQDPEIRKYYHAVEVAGDLESVARRGEVIKLAICLYDGSEPITAPLLTAAGIPEKALAISGAHWVDVMNPAASKGKALRELAGYLGCEMSQTLAFGDYLNDVELLKVAGTSYAMANAHPQLKELADHIAPSNAEEGVIAVLHSLLEGDGSYC